MATKRDIPSLLETVIRDLAVPMALLTDEAAPLGATGFDGVESLACLVGSDPELVRNPAAAVECGCGVRSWMKVPVVSDGATIGWLFAADRRRRYFDSEELHHLGLLARRAATLMPTVAPAIDVRLADTVVDIRPIETVVTTPV